MQKTQKPRISYVMQSLVLSILLFNEYGVRMLSRNGCIRCKHQTVDQTTQRRVFDTYFDSLTRCCSAGKAKTVLQPDMHRHTSALVSCPTGSARGIKIITDDAVKAATLLWETVHQAVQATMP